jgi:transposase
MLLADRGYDVDWIRALVRQHGAWANIPPKRNRTEALCFSPYLYRARNLVERLFNKIKHCRRVATRYDKLAANYLAFVQLASIRLWLRIHEPRPSAPALSRRRPAATSPLRGIRIARMLILRLRQSNDVGAINSAYQKNAELHRRCVDIHRQMCLGRHSALTM